MLISVDDKSVTEVLPDEKRTGAKNTCKECRHKKWSVNSVIARMHGSALRCVRSD